MLNQRTLELTHNINATRALIPCGVQLVAVSKTKPISDILIAYNLGIRHFGENYVQELVDKAKELPSDIHWHFIGSLQSNKCKLLALIPNLSIIETISSEKTACVLNNALSSTSGNGSNKRQSVYLQLNSSQQESKSSELYSIESVVDLAKYIESCCENVRVAGVMTIGAMNHAKDQSNPDFKALLHCAQAVGNVVGGSMAVSMGMSDDFEDAIAMGSTSVRVGSRIFGARNKQQH